jgi:hypothetical protein
MPRVVTHEAEVSLQGGGRRLPCETQVGDFTLPVRVNLHRDAGVMLNILNSWKK